MRDLFFFSEYLFFIPLSSAIYNISQFHRFCKTFIPPSESEQISGNVRKKTGYCYYRGQSYKREPNLWKSGEPLTVKDRAMLDVLVRRYGQLGYVPSQKDVPNARAIKKRFRIWKDALLAAGLPVDDTPGQSRKRTEKHEWEKRMQEILG